MKNPRPAEVAEHGGGGAACRRIHRPFSANPSLFPEKPPSLVAIGAVPVVATLRELLEAAADARRRGDHGAADLLEHDAMVALRREVRS